MAAFVQAWGGLHEKEWMARLAAGDVDNALANAKMAAMQSSKLKQEDLDKMHTQCTKLAKDDHDCLDEYQVAYQVLTDAAARDDSRVLVYGIQALAAALALKDLREGKPAVVIELAPGNGKTFVICLLAKYVEVHYPKVWTKLYVVVPEEWLIKVWYDIAASFGFQTTPEVILPRQVKDHREAKALFIVDEYYKSLLDEPLLFDAKDASVRGLIRLGHDSQQAVFFTGFLRPNFRKFLDVVSDKEWAIHQLGRAADYVNAKKDDAQFSVLADRSWGKCLEMVFAKAEEYLGQDQPVLIFGVPLEDRKDTYWTFRPKIAHINTPKDALTAAPALSNERRMVIFLAEDFTYGLDLKFQGSAKVIVLLKEDPEVETLMQQLGRGARNMNTDLGTVVIQTDAGLAESLKGKWKTDKGVDFKEGAKVIRMALACKTANLGSAGKTWLAKQAPEDWRDTKVHYFQGSPQGIQSLIPKF